MYMHMYVNTFLWEPPHTSHNQKKKKKYQMLPKCIIISLFDTFLFQS